MFLKMCIFFDYANVEFTPVDSLPTIIFTKQLLSWWFRIYIQCIAVISSASDLSCHIQIWWTFHPMYCQIQKSCQKKCSAWIIHRLEWITFEVEERKCIYGDFTVIFLHATKMVAVSFRFLVSPHLWCSICILTMKGCIWLLFSWVCKEDPTDGACYKICPLRSSSRRCLWQAACKAEGQA